MTRIFFLHMVRTLAFFNDAGILIDNDLILIFVKNYLSHLLKFIIIYIFSLISFQLINENFIPLSCFLFN